MLWYSKKKKKKEKKEKKKKIGKIPSTAQGYIKLKYS